MIPSLPLELSGERFRVVYRLVGDYAEARDKAHAICLEQTVEFPDELVPPGDIRTQIVGRIELLEQSDPQRYEGVSS